MKAVVMAGGEGSRLRPITANRPKPLVPIANRPVMEHIVELLKRHGITEIVATLHYLSDEIQSYFGDGSEFGVSMQYSIEDTPLGTAGSVKKAQDLLGSDEPFLIISGDALTDCDLTAAIKFHEEKGSLATLILTHVPNPLDFGVVITGEEGQVLRFLEKPSWSEVFSDTVNTGIYILDPAVFETMEAGKNYDWSQNIFPQLLREEKPIFGYVMEGYWADIGTLQQYRECHEHLMNGTVNLPIPGREIRDRIFVGQGSVVDPTAELIPPVVIGRECKIKAGARVGPHTCLGDHVFVEEGATVARSVVWDSAYIGPATSIASAIVGSRVTIKRDSKVMEDAVIGDRCLLDVNCTIRPRVKLWPDKQIDRGAVLTMSLIWGNKWRGTLFRDLGVAGLSNIEITPEFATRLGSAFGSTFSGRPKVVTSRDSTRSSRMIKRALIASLLSVGCDVLDLRSAPIPVTRHFIRASGALGAMNVRKLPTSPRVTLIEMFDEHGCYLAKNVERKVETAFFREDFNRIDPDDLGIIEFASRAIEEYQNDYFRLVGNTDGKRLRIVCDYGFSAMSAIFPSMLARLGADSVSLNAFNNAKGAPRSPDEIQSHLANVRSIAASLGYDLGVLFLSEGERLVVVDDRGRALSGNKLLGVLSLLVSEQVPNPRIALSQAAPRRLERALESRGVEVVRTRVDIPSLQRTALEQHVHLAGDAQGGFVFPELHGGFDGGFTLGKLIAMLSRSSATLSELADAVPSFAMADATLTCAWEAKGRVMRALAEAQGETFEVDTMDGLKLFDGENWVLVLPDTLEPHIHLFAEGETEREATDLINRVSAQIAELGTDD